ncbi:glycosyltransferase family 2 protein [Shewanella holmiensis]|uniref:Glycosyltransferase n=1 Tax=Shewanella holmiensis TaxID=2952222 RepID=A0A9X3AQA8_9GAMM|nr:glycosyltransferase [Shewanella holmiensis]MCT7942947.1 glycosyltransferase [Shewanella holmiensis]
MKRLSVSIPTYNRQHYLTKLINSIPEDTQIVVSDNGEFLTDVEFGNHPHFVKVSHKKVLPIFENWNAAIISSADTDYIAIPSDDDCYIKSEFPFIINVLNKYDADVFIFGNNFIDENDNVVGSYCPKDYEVLQAPLGFNKFLYSVDVRMPSIIFKKTFLDKIGYFDQKSFTLTAADSELIQRALLLGNVVFVPRIVSCYRVWPGGLTDQKIASKHWMDEIDTWTNKIIKLGREEVASVNWNKYKDELYARNLLAGCYNLYKVKNYKGVTNHLKISRYPWNAKLASHLRLLKIFSLSCLKRIYAF